MCAKPVIGNWGPGVRWAAADGVRGSSAAAGGGLTDDKLNFLEGSSAKEAIDSLQGDFATGQLPDVEGVSFPGPRAEAFYWSNADVHVIQGPVGSGKTTTLMMSRLRRAIEMPRSVIDGVRRYKVTFVRQTYRDLWSTTIPSYLEVFPKEMGTWSGGRGDPVLHVIHFEDDHGPIEFTAEFKAFGDNVIAGMRGLQTTDLVPNEVDTMPAEIMSVGIGRIDRWPARKHFEGLPAELRSYGQVAGDMNAPDEGNWTFRTFHDEAERKRVSRELTDIMVAEEAALARKAGREPDPVRPIAIDFTNQPGFGEEGCENLHNLSPTYYQRQIALNKLNGKGDLNDRLVYNKVTYLRAGEPVFKREFSARVHVAETAIVADTRLPLYVGLDQGFKGAAVLLQRPGYFRWRCLGELHFPEERLHAHVFGQRLRTFIETRAPGCHVECGYGDMAGEHGSSLTADENATWNLLVGRAAGFHIRPQVIGTNRVQPRLEAVRAALEAPVEEGQPGLLIDPSCKLLIRGFQARYIWKADKNGNDYVDPSGDKRRTPDKSFTEANVHDALQYGLLSGHTADGLSPYVKRIPGDNRPNQMGHNGGPPLSGGHGGGLITTWDVLDPYGDI